MKKISTRRSVKIVLLLLITLIPLGVALAGGSTVTQNSYVGGVYCTAWKRAETNGADTQYRGRIKSYTSGTNIDRIGWWWWSVQQWCGGTPWSSHNYSGHVLYDASSTASTSPYYDIYGCSNRYAKTNGEHDYVEGASSWKPNFSATYNLP